MALTKRLLPMLLVGGGAALYLRLAPTWPTEQHLRVVLGDSASNVTEIRVRCGAGGDAEWAREVTFRYAKGAAPRIVSYEPKLAGGGYVVEIDVQTDDGHVETTDRHIQLAGGSTSIDLSRHEPR